VALSDLGNKKVIKKTEKETLSNLTKANLRKKRPTDLLERFRTA